MLTQGSVRALRKKGVVKVVNKTVVLVDYYCHGSVGMWYLINALASKGFDAKLVVFKPYKGLYVDATTEKEYSLLFDFIKSEKPVLVGISMLSSFYLQIVKKVTDGVKKMGIPTVCGGMFATIAPEKGLEFTDFVIRGEGGEAITELAAALYENEDFTGIENLVYTDAEGSSKYNDLRPYMEDMDVYGVPKLNTGIEYLLDNDKLVRTDYFAKTYVYSVNASRGCYFSCSYCASPKYKKIMKDCGTQVRIRKPEKVIEELYGVKQANKRLKYLLFNDEVFPMDKEWISTFAKLYKEKINLPFRILTHPMRSDFEIINILRDAGLFYVSMGLQSGSPYIRSKIYNRHESQESIIRASEVYTECKIPAAVYDLILFHPFETIDTIRETFDLCTQLKGNFFLNINGLKFLPETEIVNMAIDAGYITAEEVSQSIDKPISEQIDFKNPDAYSKQNSAEFNLWYKLIFLTQFKILRSFAKRMAKNPNKHKTCLSVTYNFGKIAAKLKRWRFLSRLILIGK